MRFLKSEGRGKAMLCKKTARHGFTLLELLIVVIIVGILASVAIPQFTNATDKARETEGRAIIDALLTGETAYYQERGTFTAVTSELITGTLPTMKNWTNTALNQSAGTVVTVTMNGATATHNHTTHVLRGVLTDAGVRVVTNQNGA